MDSAAVKPRADRERVGAMKHVAGAGGIDGVDRVGRLAMRDAVLAQRHAVARRA